MIAVVNTTFTCKLSTSLDLPTLSRILWDSEYNPHRFPSIIMKLRTPNCSILLSKNGHVVIVGCKSQQKAEQAQIIVVRRLQSVLCQKMTTTVLSLRNMVGSGKHSFELTKHWNKSSDKISHESEIFTGIIVKLSGGMAATLFRKLKETNQGSFFITGAKSTDDLESAHIELLMRF